MPAPRPAKLDKGLAHFNRLKRSIKSDDPLLAGDILLFLRVLKTDASNWYRFINSFDLLQPVVVDGETTVRMNVAPHVTSIKRLAPAQKGSRQSLNLDQLLGLKILSINSNDFTLKSLLNAVAYSGDVHPEPEASKTDLHLIKSYLLDIAPDFAQILIRELGEVLVASFENIFAPWEGESHLNSPEHHRQPRVVVEGKVVSPQFNNSYAQCGLAEHPRAGIRLLMDYRPLVSSSKGTILALGHRVDESLRIVIERQGDRIIFTVGQTTSPQMVVIVGTGALTSDFRWLELCTYPDGTIVAALDGYPCGIGVLPRADIRTNCKLIIGADLDGRQGNSFQHNEMLVDFVERNGKIATGHRFSSQRISYSFPTTVDAPGILRRWTPPRFR